MRRRLTLTIVAVVAGALVLTGLGTLVLARRTARTNTQRDLVRQARAIAQAADDLGRPAAILAVQRALRLDNAALAHFQPRSATWIDLPPGVDAADLQPLVAAPVAAGHHGRLVYAAAAAQVPRGRIAVVLTRRLPSSGGVGYFLVAAVIALAAAAVVGDRLGRRLARPLEQAETATARIATGDLDARVPSSPNADPEMASLAASINAMAENLSRLRGLERQFLVSVSHDLRTPLTSIRGFAEAIADGVTDDDVRAATVIAAEARRLERLVADLLDLARLDARQFRFDVQAVDVAATVRDTVEGFRPAAAAAGLTLTVEIGEAGGGVVQADPERLAQVVANLVENAINFASERVAVAVERGASEVIVAVTDDGPGIAEDDQARVFERLYQPRSEGTQPRRVGSGVGLAIVAEIVSAMGGTARASAGPGGGTRMIVAFSV